MNSRTGLSHFIQQGSHWCCRQLVVATAAAAGLSSQSASAQNVPGTAYYGYTPSNITLQVPVTATVGGRCGFAAGNAPEGMYDAGDIDINAWTNDFPFVLECTGPSRIAILSTNGGLQTGSTPADPGYTATAPYTVDVNIVRNGGTTSGSCAAADLSATSGAACALRGTASPSVGLFVNSPSFGLSGSYLRVSAPAYGGADQLVSGAYADTLTVTVSPAS